MRKFLLWFLRLAIVVGVSYAIARYLQHKIGWNPSPIVFDIGNWPVLGKRIGHRDITLQWPKMIWLVVFLPYFALIIGNSLADLPWMQRWLGVFVRMCLATALIAALTRPTSQTTTSKVATVFVVDVSDSITDESLADFRADVEKIVAARAPNDTVRLITFARRPRVIPLPETLVSPSQLPAFERHDFPPGVPLPAGKQRTGDGAGSNLQSALSLAYGLFPPGYVRRVVVLTDGVQTDGDAAGEIERAKSFNVHVHTIPSRRGAPAEIAVRELRLPDKIRVHEPFEVRATVFASRPAHVTFRLRQSEVENGLEPTKTVDLVKGDNEVRFRSVVHVPGDVTYALSTVLGAAPDRFKENNQYVTTATVPGPPMVLYVEGDQGRSQYLRAGLSAGDFEVEVRGPREFPTSLREMERYDFIIMSDVAADNVSIGAQQALSRFVRDLGGGFLMSGGPRSYGLGGWQGTEVERLLPVRMEGERRRDQPAIALVLVIDRSGSMQGLPLELAKKAALATAQFLGPDDYVEVIGFDSDPERVVRMQSARNRVRIANDISRMRSGGGTAIFPALDAAYQDLRVTQAAVKHVILLTDGQAPPEGIHELVLSMVADEITVSTVGLGTGVDRPLLDNIGRVWGHGRSYFTSDPNNLPQLFLRETQTVARNAVVDEPIQPRVVFPASFLRGLDTAHLPLLMAYVSTRMKSDPAQLIMESDGDQPEPILARWRVGLGWSLAWTSDVKNRWASEWINWAGWRTFWTQLIREHMRQRRRHELGLRAELVAGNVHVAVDAISQDDRFENGLQSTLTLRGPIPDKATQEIPLRETAPGRYEATFPVDRYGAFTLHAVHKRDGHMVAESFGQVNNPYPREYAALEPDASLLTQLATMTGGMVNPTGAKVFDPEGEKIIETQQLWRYPLFVALGLLLLDILLRRVRLYDWSFKSGARRSRPAVAR